MAIICTTITYDDKELILFQIYLITLNETLQTFIQVVRVPAYISTIISAAADECVSQFVNFSNKNVQNITEIDVSLCELFRERRYLYRHICELFQKGE